MFLHATNSSTQFSFPEEFVEKIKEAFPNDPEINKALKDGAVFSLGLCMVRHGRKDLYQEVERFWRRSNVPQGPA